MKKKYLLPFLIGVVAALSATYLILEPRIVNPYHSVMIGGIAEKDLIEHQENALPAKEFETWKAAWDLRYKSDAWKKENQSTVREIERKENERQKMMEGLRRNNPQEYQEKYAKKREEYLDKKNHASIHKGEPQ